MKLLVDENISFRIKSLLTDYFEEIKHINEILPYRATDKDIWEIARRYNFTILTLDSDFKEMMVLKGFPPKVIWLRTGNKSKNALAEKLIQNYIFITNFENDDYIGILEIY